MIEKIQELLKAGQTEQALRQLALVPKWIKNSPSHTLLRATALMQSGDMDASGEILRDLERKNPNFIPLYLPLANWYMSREWPAHAMRAVKKVLGSSSPDASFVESAETLADNAQAAIQFLADLVDISFSMAEQAEWHNEQAQLALLDDNFVEVEHQARQALQIAPHWTSPRNNLAQVLYMLGKCSEAIAEAEAVLAADPANVHGLENLTIFHVGLGNLEKGQGYAIRLFDLAKAADQESLANDLAVIALAVVEDNGRLWELAQRYLHWRVDALDSTCWHCLAVATSRLGKFKEAGKFLKRAESRNENAALEELRDDISAAAKNGKEELSWLPIYPVHNLFFPKHLMGDWLEIVKKINGDKPSPGHQRQIDAFFSKHPYTLQAFKRFLWTKEGCQAGASALILANRPELDAEVLRFALSNCGDNHSRMDAIMMLSKAGRYSPDGPVHFWNADKNEWNDVLLFAQQIGEVEYQIEPDTAALIARGRQTKSPEKAIALLRRAVESDPTCAMALHNLGTLLLQNGQQEEGEKWVRQAVEVDPTYTFGFANLAFLEAQRENEEAALDFLMQVNSAKVISPATSVIANLAYMLLAVQKRDIEQARRHFDLAQEIDPGHPLLKKYEEWLDDVGLFSGGFSFLVDYQKQSANRFHRKMLNVRLAIDTTLEACLAAMTTDTLGAVCQFWKTIGYGKKQEKVARLAGRILDADIFKGIVSDLDDEERSALRWVLDGGGFRPWGDFTQRFGDDIDESPHWQWHEPESLPGRLKRTGLLHVGALHGSPVAFIPADIREQLAGILSG
ncbi:MAG: tetratricopeptide repeat protein [Anaerolineales bacterium]|nr:tetratricopeptide repeat protein [Anaerolineales bacterium]